MQLKTTVNIFYFLKLLLLLIVGVIVLFKFKLGIDYHPLIFALIINILNYKYMKYPLWIGSIMSFFISYASFFITYSLVIIIYDTLGQSNSTLALIMLNVWLYSFSPLLLMLLYKSLFKIRINKIFYIGALLLTVILQSARQYFDTKYNNIVFLLWFFSVSLTLNILIFLNQKEKI